MPAKSQLRLGLTVSRRGSSYHRFIRFFRADPVTNCWNWKGSLQRGYGKFQVGRKMLTASRVAWQYFHGAIPPGQLVLHYCDNPRCCNPGHLFLGTQQENMQDMITKGRRKSSGPRIKFTADQLLEIGLSPNVSELARRFGVSRSAIRRVISRMCPTPKDGYHLADGQSCPGTTTIIDRFKNSAPLIAWAYNQGKSGAPRYEKKAADIGTRVHEMVEADLHGRELAPHPGHFTEDMRAAADHGFENYRREIARSKAFFLPLEVQLISEKYKYGGTPDAIVEFEDEISIGDWKSSNGVYLDHIIQLAAYRELWNSNHPDQQATSGRIYRFSKESGIFAEHSYGPEVLDRAFRQFVLFREAYELDLQLKRLV
jgi:hypothetical protein